MYRPHGIVRFVLFHDQRKIVFGRTLRNRNHGGARVLVFWYALLCAFVLAALVGISRFYLGYHYPSDVAAGWLLGMLFMLAFCLADKFTERRR